MSHALDTIRRFWDLAPKGIVHVGANKGQEVEAYKAQPARPVVLIEPLPEQFKTLTQTVDGEPGFYCVQACCSDVSGKTVEFHVASNSGQSSSYKKPAAHLALYPNIKFASEPLVMQTQTLDDVIAGEGIAFNDLEYLSIDVQGAEMDVLKGAPCLLDCISFAWIEVNFGGLYENDVDLYQMTDFMRSKGFHLYYLVMRKHRWGDALYIRDGVVRP